MSDSNRQPAAYDIFIWLILHTKTPRISTRRLKNIHEGSGLSGNTCQAVTLWQATQLEGFSYDHVQHPKNHDIILSHIDGHCGQLLLSEEFIEFSRRRSPVHIQFFSNV